jgi:hypothetical protein
MKLYYKNEISIDEQSLFPSLLKNKKSNFTSIVLSNHIDLFTITCTKAGSLLLKPIMKTFSEKTHIMGQNSRSIFTLISNVEILQLTSPMKSPAKYLYLSILSLQGNNIRITPDTKGIFDETEIKGNKLFTQKIDIQKHKSDELAFIISANISSLVDIEVIEVIHYNFSEYVNIKSKKNFQKIAFCAGSGSEFIDEAYKNGADAYITGDLKFHTALDSPIPVYDIGHFESEIQVLEVFKRLINNDSNVIFAKEESPFMGFVV